MGKSYSITSPHKFNQMSVVLICICIATCVTVTHTAWFHRSPKVYYFSNEEKTFFTAQNDCSRRGANLVTIHDYFENQFLYDSHSGGKQYWIGLQCFFSFFHSNCRWVSGAQSYYRDWAPSTGSGSYAVIGFGDKNWKRSSGSNHKRFICDKEDGCHNPPHACEHGATCVAHATGGYSCACMTGYTGDYCETGIGYCSSDPCIYGTCIDGINAYTCACNASYTSTNCDVDIDECDTPDFCNNGECENSPGGYQCTCNIGFEGDRCAQNISECNRYPGICQNGGSCTDTQGSYECTCAPGYIGDNCSTEAGECLSTPCLNGATCYDVFNNYSCACPPEFTGAHCENDIDECTLQIYCGQGQCTNTYGSFECICPQGLGGVNCLDIDECLYEEACNFHGNCTNHFGGFSCHCHDGFRGDSCSMTDNAPNRNTKTKGDKVNFNDNLMAIVFVSTSAFLFLLLCCTLTCFIVKRKQWISRLKRQTPAQESSNGAEGIRDPNAVNVELDEYDDARTTHMHPQGNVGEYDPDYTEVHSVPDKQELDAYHFYTKVSSKQK